jgi:hypothetical protein
MYIEEKLKAEILNEAITKKWWGHLADVRWPKRLLETRQSPSV